MPGDQRIKKSASNLAEYFITLEKYTKFLNASSNRLKIYVLTFNYQNYHPRENGMVKYYYHRITNIFLIRKVNYGSFQHCESGCIIKFWEHTVHQGREKKHFQDVI